jgi:hypothetical protein
MPSRASKAALTVDSSADRDIGISLGISGELDGLFRDLGGESQGGMSSFSSVVITRLVRNCALGRVIQYAATSEDHFEGRGVPDAPPSRGMTAEGGGGRAP